MVSKILVLVLSMICYVHAQMDESEPWPPIRKCKGPTYHIENQLVDLHMSTSGSHRSLIIVGCKNGSFIEANPFDPDLFKDYNWLEVQNIQWPLYPQMNTLTVVVFYSVKLRGVWSSCSDLFMLTLYNTDLSVVPSVWLKNCTNLRKLYFDEMSVTQIRKAMYSAPNLDLVQFSRLKDVAGITQIPLFEKSAHLQSLTDVCLYLQPGGSKLNDGRIINTTTKEISIALLQQLSLLPRLRKLEIIHASDFDMCILDESVTLGTLQYLSLYGTNTTSTCFNQLLRMPLLRRLRIESSPHLDVKFGELYSTSAPNLNVSVTNARSFKFSRDDYLSLSDVNNEGRVKIDGIQSVVNCDCRDETFWLARSIRMGLVSAPGLVCYDGKKDTSGPCDRLECYRVSCNSSCVCCKEPNGDVVADCRSASLTALPAELLAVKNLTQLLAPDNRIRTLPAHLPGTLKWLDISGNQIHQLDPELTTILFGKERRVRLAGNPLVCSNATCYNKPLLAAVKNQQVEDAALVDCGGEVGKLITLSDVCKSRELDKQLAREQDAALVKEHEAELARDREKVLITSVAVAVTVAVVALALATALYYRRTIQIILYAHGWCQWWVKEEELDEHRRYDVFLSFCHDDAEAVLEQLLPNLDRDYAVCVHLRDWYPGEMIPSHIQRSVEESRRTLVVLSKNFVKSLWGLLEFQTAYASGLEDRRIRVVMVILDDVLESSDLQGEWRQYVKYNTYVKWGDPWFWDKLRYALPHRPIAPETVGVDLPRRYEAPALVHVVTHDADSHETQSGRQQAAIDPPPASPISC